VVGGVARHPLRPVVHQHLAGYAWEFLFF
jgi:hypothetical protein